MKKIAYLLMASAVVFSISGCSENNDTSDISDIQDSSQVYVIQKNESKNIVLPTDSISFEEACGFLDKCSMTELELPQSVTDFSKYYFGTVDYYGKSYYSVYLYTEKDDKKIFVGNNVLISCDGTFAIVKNLFGQYEKLTENGSQTDIDYKEIYPDVKIVTTAKSVALIKQFFDFDIDTRIMIVKEGDSLNTGKHELIFILAPMVHWPEVMVTYDKTDKALYSADAFGSFGAINGNLTDSGLDFEKGYLDEARRYYTNIVGKYGMQVQMLLKKLCGFDIQIIYPLHGLVIKDNINTFIEKYDKWSKYEAEEKAVLIAFSSVYGGTENAVNILAGMLADKGVNGIKVYDVSQTHYSYVLSDAFKYSNIVFATTTYNNGIFESMENLLHNIVSHNLQNRKVVLIQNGSWAPVCGGQMKAILEKLPGTEFIDESLCIKSALKENQLDELECLADKIVNSLE